MPLEHRALGLGRSGQMPPGELDLERLPDRASGAITNQWPALEHGFDALWARRFQGVGDDWRLDQQHSPCSQVVAQAGEGTSQGGPIREITDTAEEAADHVEA